RQVGRDERRRRSLSGEQDLFSEGAAIDGEGKRAADPRIVERRAADVEAEKIRVKVMVGAQRGRVLAAVDRDLVGEQDVGGVELPGAKGALLCVRAVDAIKMNRVQPAVGA